MLFYAQSKMAIFNKLSFQTRKPRSKSKMLFEDEDVLFGGTPAESPPVDLFAPGSPVSPTKVI